MCQNLGFIILFKISVLVWRVKSKLAFLYPVPSLIKLYQSFWGPSCPLGFQPWHIKIWISVTRVPNSFSLLTRLHEKMQGFQKDLVSFCQYSRAGLRGSTPTGSSQQIQRGSAMLYSWGSHPSYHLSLFHWSLFKGPVISLQSRMSIATG